MTDNESKREEASQHTPEPWHYAYEGSGSHTVFAPDDCVIAEVVEGEGCDRDRAAANARVIAAVPKLLAACKEALREQHNDADMVYLSTHLLRAAIAEAEPDAP